MPTAEDGEAHNQRVELSRVLGPGMKAALPAQDLTQVIGRTCGHDRHGQESHRNNSQREQDACCVARKRTQCFGSLRRSFDVRLTGYV
jgi:hypothetical protein